MKLEKIFIKDYKNISDKTFELGKCPIDGFFENNISNVTAIIGANGCGKSTLLEFIFRCKHSLDSIENKEYTINGKKESENLLSDIDVILYSTQVTSKRPYGANVGQVGAKPEKNPEFNLSTDVLLDQAEQYTKFRQEEIKKQIAFISKFLSEQEDKNLLFEKDRLPIYLKIKLVSEEPKAKTYKNNIDDFIKEFDKILDNKKKDVLDKFEAFLTINKSEIQFVQEGNNTRTKYNRLLIPIDKIENDNPIFNLLDYLDLSFAVDNNPNNYFAFSTGEYMMLTLFSRLYNVKSKVEKDNVLLLLDEGELGMHPQWQKKYLQTLLKVLPKIFDKATSIQLILTSHSPFLVSDLPKENVIFLKKRSDGKCEVSNLEGKEQTFGQNIHTLFADSFFLYDGEKPEKSGLIGEFAKAKIKKLISDIEKLENKETINQRIDMIGEPYLKSKLRNYYRQKSIQKNLATEDYKSAREILEKDLEYINKLESSNQTKNDTDL